MARAVTRYRRGGFLQTAGRLAARAIPYVASLPSGQWGKSMGMKRRANRQADQTPSNTTTGPPTTFQHDNKTSYKRRRAPKRVRRRAQRDARKFENNMSTLMGCKRLVDNNYNIITGAANQQTVFGLNFMDTADMQKVFGLFSVEGSPTTTYDLNNLNTQSNEILIKRLRCEIELKNTSSNLAFVDLYYWYPRKDCTFQASSAIGGNFGVNSGGTFNGSGTLVPNGTVAANINGVTPFDFPSFTENFVVYRVRRVMLQGNQSFSFDLKARPGNQSTKDWYQMVLRRNISSGVMIFVQGEVTATPGTATTSIAIHRQLWVTAYKQGGKGAVSESYVGTGL